ncbi:hypothetical protein [Euzebya tangerina]|uniref:hypothetical protein n=1 Tax=Euzebya tangerina TaxID=591198 RepID=UPI000E30E584|nr:hypothetical protein [Euzebya tangerina]
MTPETWADVGNWLLLAVGAAMFFGTGFAVLSFRRNGVFPGQELDDDGLPTHEPALRTAYVKIVLGLVLGVWGLAGLTAGTVIGLS